MISNHRRFASALLATALALVQTNCGDDEGGGGDTTPELLLHVPSPNWADQVIYFVMLDRFADGDPSNNDQGAGEFDPTVNSHYSGGDLQGVIDRLDYIQGLGATAVWITPPVANQWWDPLAEFSGYHGYWARNLKQVDAHYGDLETYQALSDALHERGMYLIQDIVTNHTGNFFTYQGEYDPADPTQNVVRNPQSLPGAAPEQPPFDQNDVTQAAHREAAIYHWTPAIADYLDPLQELTYQVSDLDDLNTENPVVRQALRDSYGYWIDEVGVDGYRIDTVKFVEHAFWNDFIHSTDAAAPGLNAVAAATGREDFLTFGEVFEVSEPFDDAGEIKVSSFLGTPQAPELRAVLGFPLYEEMGRVFAEGRPTSAMTYRLEQFLAYFPDPFTTPNFLDNHDVGRFLEGGSEEALRQALVFLFTIPGIPVVYYGTEQGFSDTRASMFAAGWGSDGIDHFDTQALLYAFIRDLIALRRSDPVFSRGELTVLQDNPAGAGALAYTRTLDGAQALVLLNTADEAVLVEGLDTGLAPGAELEVVLWGGEIPEPRETGWVAGEDGDLLVELPARAAWVVRASGGVGNVPAPGATITVDTALQSETFTEDVEVTGTVDPADTDLLMVLDGYLDRATPVTVEDDGTWTATIPISLYPVGETPHAVIFYAAGAGAASPRFLFTANVIFEGTVITEDDDSGDDAGPAATYVYPEDVTFTDQMDILQMVVEAGSTNPTLSLKFTMASHSIVWAPPNDFDHVAFTIFFDVPGQEGLTVLPLLQAQAPEGFAWDFTHFAFGWANSLHSTENAAADERGRPIAGAPLIRVDAANRLVVFTYDRTDFGLESWGGVTIYATTWDFDGIDNIYRPIVAGGGQWVMGGGQPTDPYIMDDVPPVTIAAEE